MNSEGLRIFVILLHHYRCHNLKDLDLNLHRRESLESLWRFSYLFSLAFFYFIITHV
jgi:hypothetical protein